MFQTDVLANGSFIPLEVKDSSLCGLTNHQVVGDMIEGNGADSPGRMSLCRTGFRHRMMLLMQKKNVQQKFGLEIFRVQRLCGKLGGVAPEAVVIVMAHHLRASERTLSKMVHNAPCSTKFNDEIKIEPSRDYCVLRYSMHPVEAILIRNELPSISLTQA